MLICERYRQKMQLPELWIYTVQSTLDEFQTFNNLFVIIATLIMRFDQGVFWRENQSNFVMIKHNSFWICWSVLKCSCMHVCGDVVCSANLNCLILITLSSKSSIRWIQCIHCIQYVFNTYSIHIFKWEKVSSELIMLEFVIFIYLFIL